jgi:hypothetical protein
MSSKKAKEPSKPYSRTSSRAGSPEIPEGDAQAILQKEALKYLVVPGSVDFIMQKSEPERSEFVRKSLVSKVQSEPHKLALINKYFSEDPKDLTRANTLKNMGYNDKSIDQIMVKVGKDRQAFVRDKVIPFIKIACNGTIIARMFGVPPPTAPAAQQPQQQRPKTPP